MPVFHTKAIESILEPVAQQVSHLVVLHEEGEGGRAITDITTQVITVGEAIKNLIGVARAASLTSKDEILTKELPTILPKVEQVTTDLQEAAHWLKTDPLSIEGRKKLINGSRGVINATSALLLAFDDSEVRKILTICRQVLEYIQVAEVVEQMQDMVTFVRNLTPAITNMAKQVDNRILILTHTTHRDMLHKHLTGVKETVQKFVKSSKAYILALEKNVGRAEAQEGRNFMIMKICDDIIEIMRILQLKVDDEYELEDPTNLMRKARHRLQEKIKMAKVWLDNPEGEANGLGEKALRDIVKQARQVGHLVNDQEIKQLCEKLDQQITNLSMLRGKGLGNSPEALRLAKDIDTNLEHLAKLVDAAISREVTAGTRLPAATTAGQYEQSVLWIDDPRSADNVIGRRAVDALLADGKRLAKHLPPNEQKELLETISEVDSLTKQLATLKANGKGNSAEAQQLQHKLKGVLTTLKVQLQKGAIDGVISVFKEIGHGQALKQLEKAAHAPAGAPNREQDYEEKAGAFEYHTSKMIETAEQTAIHGKHATSQLVDNIHAAAKDLAELTPQISHAGKLLLMNPGNDLFHAHFTDLCNDWRANSDELIALVDAATDTLDYMKASEECIKKEIAGACVGLEQQNPAIIVARGGNAARMSLRVEQVANAEAENSETTEFRESIMKATQNLKDSNSQFLSTTKNVAMNPKYKPVQIEFRNSGDKLIGRVVDVRTALYPPPPTPPPSPPPPVPPPPQAEEVAISRNTLVMQRPELVEVPPVRPPAPIVEGLIAADESQELHSMLERPPDADNRMAVAAHQLHVEATKWEDEGNQLIQAARQMAILFAKMSKFITDEDYFQTHSKKELIDTAKMISWASSKLVKQAKEIADKCPDKRMRGELNLTIERMPTIATQLKILATVKATMFGANDPQADLEATEMLVGCAENLMGSARSVVRDCEAASIKIRTGHGVTVQWKPQTVYYY